MKLGIVYKDNKVINHRSLFKVLFNPIFRYFGFCFSTVVENNQLGNYQIIRCGKAKVEWDFKYHNDYDRIVKSRVIF